MEIIEIRSAPLREIQPMNEKLAVPIAWTRAGLKQELQEALTKNNSR